MSRSKIKAKRMAKRRRHKQARHNKPNTLQTRRPRFAGVQEEVRHV